jgi:hypothetical protein
MRQLEHHCHGDKDEQPRELRLEHFLNLYVRKRATSDQ